MTWAPGESDQKSIDQIRELFADVLDGHEVMANNSRWISFTTVRNEHWVHDNVVLLGDAAHTAHFSIGSGTKLAMEDALTLAACLHEEDSVRGRAGGVRGRSARPSCSPPSARRRPAWSGSRTSAQYVDQEPLQFGFNIMTRSRRVTYDNLRVRDPEFVARCDEWFAGASGSERCRTPPMFQPFRPRRARPCPTGSSSRRWTCTSPRTACPATSTSCTSAARRSAAPDW